MGEWMDKSQMDERMDRNVHWRINGWEDISQIDRWTNRYNTFSYSETIGPKWAIVVSSNLETKNDDEKISTASTVGPSLSTHLENPTVRYNNMEITLKLSWTML